MRIKLLFLCILIIGLSSCNCQKSSPDKNRFINYNAIKSFPNLIGYINDFEDLFSSKEKEELDSIIKDFEHYTSNEIVIVTINSVDPYLSLQDFSTDLGNYWGIGKKGLDNGLIIVMSKQKKQIWIGTGYGTEKILTNELLQNIIDNDIIPFFKNEEYFKGIKFGLLECINNWKARKLL